MIATLLAADHLPPASLPHARELRDDLARLLARERTAAADFLLALADFDARRGWEPLGHAGLFAFLTRELGLSKGGAFFRLTAARLVVRYPEVLEPLRDGRLCITTVVELARVLSPGNVAEVLPRFFGCSSREAREVAAALAPREAPPMRDAVTAAVPVRRLEPVDGAPAARVAPEPPRRHETVGAELPLLAAPADLAPPAGPRPVPSAVQSTEPPPTQPIRARDQVEPLDAELRRLHVTVSRAFLAKLEAGRAGLSHALPGATTEQVLERALDLLLERQARARALVRRPRRPAPAPALSATAPEPSTPLAPSAGPARQARSRGAPPGPRNVPAHVEREVRLRDGGRCQFPLDAGGVCGSTWQVELDHLTPVALGGKASVENLRLACRFHNRYAARLALGEAAMAGRRRGRHG